MEENKNEKIIPYGDYEDSPKLDDSQLNQLTEAAEDQKNPTSQLMRDINEGKIKFDNDGELKSAVCNMKLQDDTGIFELSPVPKENDSLDIDGVESLTDKDLFKVNLTDEKAKEIGSMYNIEDTESILKIMDLAKRFNNKEKLNYYEEFPKEFKTLASQLAIAGGVSKKTATEDILTMFINDVLHSEMFVDFNNMIKKELDIPNLTEMFADTLQDNIENGFEKKAQDCLQKADELESLGDSATQQQRDNIQKLRDRAKIYRDIIVNFKHSYTLDLLLEFAQTHPTFVRKLPKEAKRYQRWATDFNYKYKGSKFTIQDISLIINSLMREFEKTDLKLSLEEAKSILVLISMQTREYDANDVVDQAYLFYIVSNLIQLNYVAEGRCEYMDTLKSKIVELVHLMRNTRLNEVK